VVFLDRLAASGLPGSDKATHQSDVAYKKTSNREKTLFRNSIRMYAPNMWKRFGGVPAVVLVAWSQASCTSAARNAAWPVPEPDQVVGAAMKELYLAASAAAPQSPAQQKVIVRMADKASNGKELLLAMRAAVGVFPADQGGPVPLVESQVRSIVTAKMLEAGTLDQLIEYATRYSVAPEWSRAFVRRMSQLGGENSDPRVWDRIRAAAFRLKVGDPARQAPQDGPATAVWRSMR
jgi:hypothetical protein